MLFLSVKNREIVSQVEKKLSPPLISLLSSEHEIQYVALRNMQLIAMKRPSILAGDVKVRYSLCIESLLFPVLN